MYPNIDMDNLISLDWPITTTTNNDNNEGKPAMEPISQRAYKRNTIADEDPRELRKLIIAEPRVGLRFIQLLQEASEGQKKTIDVTGKRRERKSVLDASVWEKAQSELMDKGIILESREKGEASSDRARATLTYYGSSAVFFNHQVKTKLRMRIRYYLSYTRTSEGKIVDVQREGVTKDKGFLELKVKSPRAFEENSVDKYRLLVSDTLISELINLDATHPNFLQDMQRLSADILRDNEGKEELTVTMFSIMAALAKRKPAFIRPSLVITYERSAFKYIEKNYPVKKTKDDQTHRVSYRTRKSRRGYKLLSSAIRWICTGRRSAQHISLEKQESTEPVSDITDNQKPTAPTKQSLKLLDDDATNDDCWLLIGDEATPCNIRCKDVEFHDIEYQFTIDKYVRAHYPLLPIKGATVMPVVEHFDSTNQTEIMRYPTNARVVEFKEPLLVANLPRRYRTATHNGFLDFLVERMREYILFSCYDENVGKYGNFRRRLMEEKSTDRIKNTMIDIDLSGSGEYLLPILNY